MPPFKPVDTYQGKSNVGHLGITDNPEQLLTGNLTWADDADAHTGNSDITGQGGSGLDSPLTITDNITIPDGDAFDVIEITVIDSNGVKSTGTIDEADGTLEIADASGDGIDLTALPLKVYALVKTDNAPAGKVIEFWIEDILNMANEQANNLSGATYGALPQEACALLTGNVTWQDNNSLNGNSNVTGSSGLDGLTDHIIITDEFVIPDGDTFVRLEVTVKDQYNIRVTETIGSAGGSAQINDGEDGIDLTTGVLRVIAQIFTANCSYGKTVRFEIVKSEPTAIVSGYTAPNVINGLGTIGKFVRYSLKKANNPAVAIISDEGYEAWTGSEVGTFTGETFEDGDKLCLDVVDDISGTNILSSNYIKVSIPSYSSVATGQFSQTAIITTIATGAYIVATKIVDTASNSVVYYDADGSLLNGTGNLIAGQTSDIKPISIVTGSGTIADITNTVKTFASEDVTIPANTSYAIGHLSDGDAIFTTDGTDPDNADGALIGARVSDGGKIELYGADSISNFKVLSLDDSTPIDIVFEFKNVKE